MNNLIYTKDFWQSVWSEIFRQSEITNFHRISYLCHISPTFNKHYYRNISRLRLLCQEFLESESITDFVVTSTLDDRYAHGMFKRKCEDLAIFPNDLIGLRIKFVNYCIAKFP